jgi:hypothetical protein
MGRDDLAFANDVELRHRPASMAEVFVQKPLGGPIEA